MTRHVAAAAVVPALLIRPARPSSGPAPAPTTPGGPGRFSPAGLALLLLVALISMASCGGGNPVPQPPAPPPSPAPPPPPPFDEACQALLDLGLPWCDAADMTCGDCLHNPTADPRHCQRAEPCPEPPPEPPPPEPIRPQARVYWHQGATVGKTCVATGRCIADATPAQCGAGWCRQWKAQDGTACFVNDAGQERYCCPPGCEDDEGTYPRQVQLMGGPAPIWHLEVESGTLRLVDDPWFGIVAGSGKGELWYTFPNGKATSARLRVDKP